MSFTRRRTAGLPGSQVVATVSNEQLPRAGREPTRGWPAYSTLYPAGDPALAVRDLIFSTGNYKDLDPWRGWVTGDPMEPPPRARIVAGAGRARGPPRVGRDYQV